MVERTGCQLADRRAVQKVEQKADQKAFPLVVQKADHSADPMVSWSDSQMAVLMVAHLVGLTADQWEPLWGLLSEPL